MLPLPPLGLGSTHGPYQDKWTDFRQPLFSSPPAPVWPLRLLNLLRSIPDTLQQAWSSITNANASLLKVASTIETTEHLLQSLSPLASSWQGDQTHIPEIFEFIHSFRQIDVKAAWVELGQVWTNFSLKMETFTSGAERLKSLPGFNRLF
jgi:hypothetical protein